MHEQWRPCRGCWRPPAPHPQEDGTLALLREAFITFPDSVCSKGEETTFSINFLE